MIRIISQRDGVVVLINGMWYLRNQQIWLILGFYMFCPKYVKFCFQNLWNGRKDQNGPE